VRDERSGKALIPAVFQRALAAISALHGGAKRRSFGLRKLAQLVENASAVIGSRSERRQEQAMSERVEKHPDEKYRDTRARP